MQRVHVCMLLLLIGAATIVFPLARLPGATAQEQTILFTHQLTQSTGEYQFWTTPPAERVFRDDAVPTETGAQVNVFAARNEFEPFQLVVKPATTQDVTISMGDFGSGITSEIAQVDYVTVSEATDSLGRTGDYPDPLWPLENGATVTIHANENTAFWVTLFVPASTAAGDYTTTMQIGGVSIPIALHVFDFAIPDELHIKSQMNFSHQAVLEKYGVSGTGDEYWQYVNAMKQFFIDHRLTPKAPLWSGGLTSGGAPYIDYDCATQTFTDNDGIWGFEEPADTYLNGTGFNDGTGFPSFMAVTFRNNDASDDQRPDEFCGETRNATDWYTAANPATAYNQQWFAYMTSMQEYLRGLGYLDKSYYYFANEPQDQADYDAVAWYSQELKRAAPDLQLMVSEEPKPEIYDHPTHTGTKIDIWLPVLNQYDPEVSHERARTHGEETWVYFLHGTRPPYFNPITLDHPGIESKLTGWFLWKYRIRGIAYYSMNNWSKNPWTDPLTDGHNGDLFMLYPPSRTNDAISYGANNHRFVPSIRFELMRDSLEDYEYLYILNGGNQPQVDQANDADAQADTIISGLTSYERDSEVLYNLRRFIGMYNGGEIAEIPDVAPPDGEQPRNVYINFQDPAGEPGADPLIVDGKEYMKIGWNTYDESLGYGWYGDMDHVMYQYLSDGPNELQKSVLYDDWGRLKTFVFDLPNGDYSVTVSVGWHGRTYEHNKIDIEGVSFIDDEASNPYIVRTNTVTIADGNLTMEMGIFDEYTMLNYLDIEALNPPEETPTEAPTEQPTATPTPAPPTEPAASKTTARAAVAADERFDYVLTYDAGTITHTLVISDSVPAVTEVITATASKEPAPLVDGQNVSWNGPVDRQERITLTITVRGVETGVVTNTATFSGTQRLTENARVTIAAEDDPILFNPVYLPLVSSG